MMNPEEKTLMAPDSLKIQRWIKMTIGTIMKVGARKWNIRLTQ